MLADLEVLRRHYALTLAEWNRRFQAAWPALAARFDDKTLVYGETMPINDMLDRWSSSPFAEIARRDDVRAFVQAALKAVTEEEKLWPRVPPNKS